ncbi:MAG: hypothetical protein RLZZ211_638 [Bacteroidota bacterium]
MNQLDDFEKHLRDQLKGHVEPEPLMWRRLTDALGRVQPWYARSAFKYALTAIGAMVFGAISTYLYMDQQQIKHTDPSMAQTATKKMNLSAKEGSALIVQAPQTERISASSLTQIAQESQLYDQNASAQILDTNTPLHSNDVAAISFEQALPNLAIRKLKTTNPTLQHASLVSPALHRLALSVSTGHLQTNLPTFDYQLGPNGTHQASQIQKTSPLLQLQILLFRNWSFNAGIQQINTNLEEHFYQTDVYSFDEKEHFLFPYLYGFRQMSDEELHEGPWPLGPNPPGGPENVHVKANYTSQIQQQQLIVPLTFSYHKQFGSFEAQLHAGLALYFNYQTLQTLRIPGYLPSSIYLNQQNDRVQTFAQSQLRLSYLANPHLSIFVEPQFRSSFQRQNEIHSTPYRTNSRALNAGICWKF